MTNQTEQTDQPTISLKSMAIRGSFWTIAGHGLGQTMRLGSNLVLTRLLFPEAFGLMALLTAFMTGLHMLTDMGLGPNVIQNKNGDDPRFYNTVYSIQVIRGVVIWLGACTLAIPFARFYDQPELLQLLPVACTSVLILGFRSTSLHTLYRRLSIRRAVMLEWTAMVVRISVTIGWAWAWAWPSVWALVVGHVSHSIVMAIASHFVVSDVRNGFAWDRSAIKEIFHFGKWVFVSTLFTFAAAQADRLMVGKMVSMQTLGVYMIAIIWAMVPVKIFNQLSDSLLFPLCSKLHTAGRPLMPILRKLRRTVSVGGAIVAAGVMIFGSLLIEILYDPRYMAAGPILQILAAGIWFTALGSTYKPVLFAIGKTQWGAIANGAKFAALVVILPVGFALWGLHGVVAGLVVAEMVRYTFFMIGMKRRGMAMLAEDLALTCMLIASVLGCLWVRSSMMQMGYDRWTTAGAQALLLVCWLPQILSLRKLFMMPSMQAVEAGS